jgi:ParB family transcriptional regulator, chromosome partitioning protein
MNPGKSAKVEWLPLDQVTLYERNARTHDARNVQKLAASLKEFGWTNPVLVTGSNEVIAGHGRVLAARSLGMDKAPVLRLTHLSPAQVKAYRIAGGVPSSTERLRNASATRRC